MSIPNRIGQVGPEQVGPEQVGPGQVGPGQVGPEQVGPRPDHPAFVNPRVNREAGAGFVAGHRASSNCGVSGIRPASTAL